MIDRPSSYDDYYMRMLIPMAFRSAELVRIPAPQSRVIRQYIENFKMYRVKGWGLMLWGNFGSGKTASGCVILKEAVVRNQMTGLWILASDIPKFVIEKTVFDKDQSMIERIESVDLLVIDEVILHQGDKFTDIVVESVLRKRIGCCLPTCLTTNLSPDQFKSAYPALANVMTEAVWPVRCEGNFRNEIKSDIEKAFKE